MSWLASADLKHGAGQEREGLHETALRGSTTLSSVLNRFLSSQHRDGLVVSITRWNQQVSGTARVGLPPTTMLKRINL